MRRALIAATILLAPLFLAATTAPAATYPVRLVFAPLNSQQLTDAKLHGFVVLEDYGSFVVGDAASTTIDWFEAHSTIAYPPIYALGRGAFHGDPKGGNLVPTNWTSTSTKLHIVQYNGPVKAEWRETLLSLGFVPLFGLSSGSVVAQATSYLKTPPSTLSGLRWTGPYHPGFRISSDLIYDSGSAQTLIVGNPRFNESALRTNAINAGCTPTASWTGSDGARLLCSTTASARRALAYNDAIVWMERQAPAAQTHMQEARAVLQSGTRGTTKLHDFGLTGQGQIIGLIDTGIRAAEMGHLLHAQLDDPTRPAPYDTTADLHRTLVTYSRAQENEVVYGDFDDANPAAAGHGTIMAAIIAGDASASPPHGQDGMAPRARLAMIDIGPPAGAAITPTHDYAVMYDAAYRAGARIISASWGSATDGMQPYTDVAHEIDSYFHQHPDTLLFTSAGNSGARSLTREGVAKNLLVVGAVESRSADDPTLSPDDLATFSSRGPTLDGRIKPDVVAPGVPITSVDPTTTTGMTTRFGTSQATAMTAAGASLLREYLMSGRHPTGAPAPGDAMVPSAALLRAMIVAGSTPITGHDATPTPSAWPNGNQGWGRVDLETSITPPDARQVVLVDGRPLSLGESWTLPLQVTSNSSALKVALAWTDCPGTAGTPLAICSDLQLFAVSPSGGVYLGNNIQPETRSSLVGGAPDLRNVIEQVLVPTPSVGRWTIGVVATGPVPSFGVAALGSFGTQSSNRDGGYAFAIAIPLGGYNA